MSCDVSAVRDYLGEAAEGALNRNARASLPATVVRRGTGDVLRRARCARSLLSSIFSGRAFRVQGVLPTMAFRVLKELPTMMLMLYVSLKMILVVLLQFWRRIKQIALIF
jgi:hypothetical protein